MVRELPIFLPFSSARSSNDKRERLHEEADSPTTARAGDSSGQSLVVRA
jgi:hypothetical protein